MANLLAPVANLHECTCTSHLIWGREFTLVISPVGDISPCLCVCGCVGVECVCVCVKYAGVESVCGVCLECVCGGGVYIVQLWCTLYIGCSDGCYN